MSKKDFYYDIMALHSEVTGSCIPVVVHYPNDEPSTRFIVDCGMFQEEKYNHLNREGFPFYAENIEFVLVTHSHLDHIGRIPSLYKEGYHGKVYTTKATKRFMKVSLRDYFKNMRKDCQRKKQEPLYNQEDLETALGSIESCDFREPEYINKYTKVTFLENGHGLGAASILVQISYPGRESYNLLFTGDYKPNNRFFDVEDFPQWVYDLPRLFQRQLMVTWMPVK